MKKILLISIPFIAVCIFTACDDSLKGELFEKKVLINQNGFREYSLDFVGTSEQDTMFTVAVSGSEKTDRDIVVTLTVNADTLAGYNWERFRNDESQYYELLPPDMYSFQTDNIVIKAGTEYTSVPVTFYLDKFDREAKYVLPVSIAAVSEYTVAEPQYSTILMNTVLSNEYSGSFSLSGTITEVETGDRLDIQTTRTLRAESENSVSLYAGNIAENATARENYRIMMTVNDDNTLSFEPVHPEIIELTADEPAHIEDPESFVNMVSVTRQVDAQNSRRVFVTTTFHMSYNYIDKTEPDTPIEYRWSGMASRSETITLRQ